MRLRPEGYVLELDHEEGAILLTALLVAQRALLSGSAKDHPFGDYERTKLNNLIRELMDNGMEQWG